MNKHSIGALIGAFFLIGSPNMALAQISELRLGLLSHNAEINAKNGGKEKGPDIEAQIVFESPSWLEWAQSPKPIIVGNLNTQGETSFFGGGLEWGIGLGENFELQPFLGIVVHNGDPLNNPYAPADSVRRAKFNAEELALGSRNLFWLGLNLERKINEDWAVAIHYEHLSHGQILGEGKNQGLDNIGLRIGRKF